MLNVIMLNVVMLSVVAPFIVVLFLKCFKIHFCSLHQIFFCKLTFAGIAPAGQVRSLPRTFWPAKLARKMFRTLLQDGMTAQQMGIKIDGISIDIITAFGSFL